MILANDNEKLIALYCSYHFMFGCSARQRFTCTFYITAAVFHKNAEY